MAVSSTDTFSGPYEANGVTVAFPFTFKAVSVDDVAVILRDADGVDDWINPSAYTVTLAAEGGTVTFSAAPVSGSVYVISEPSFLQSIDFASGQPFLPSVVNEANDRSATRALYLKREIERAPRAPIGGGSAAGLFPRVKEDGSWEFQPGTDSDPFLRQELADPVTGAGLIGFVDGEAYDPDTIGKRVGQLDLASAPTGEAIQARAEAPADNGQRVELVKQDYPLDTPLQSGGKAIEYQGAGMLATRLLVSGAHGAIEHGLDSQEYFASLTLKNLGISAAGAGIGTAQTAVKAKFDKNGPGVFFENVRFGTFNGGYGFNKFVELTGATRSTMRSVRFQGNVFGNPAERAAGPQIGVHLISHDNADKSYEYVFEDVLAEIEDTAFKFEVLGPPGNSGSLEGITFTNLRGRTNIGPLIDFKVEQGGWKPPFFSIGAGFNYQGTGAIAHFDGIEGLTIDGGGWHAFDTALPGSPSLNQIQITNARKVTIRSQTFRIFDGAELEWVLAALSGCDDILLENLTFVYEGSATIAGGGFFDVATTNLRIRDCVFHNWPVGLPKFRLSDGTDIPEDYYSSVGAPGFVVSTELAAPTGADRVGFQQAGAGAVARTSYDKLAEIASPQDFGAQGDNAADDRAAFVSANARGGLTFIPKPPSKYKLATPFATTSAAWLPDPSMTWAQLTDSGKFDMTCDFFSDGYSYFANIWRFSDRLFVGTAAARFAGSGSLPDQGEAWLKSADDGPAYLAANAQFLSMTNDTRYAIVGAAKTTLSGAGGAIGVGSVLIADGAKTGWGFIAELQREGTGSAYGLEVAAKNKGSNTTMGVNAQQVGVFGVWLSAGGDGVFGGSPTAPSTAGVAFVKGHAPGTTWNDGIIFQRDAMTSDRVLKMSSVGLTGGHYYSWFNASDSETFVLRGSAVAAGVTWKMEVNDNGFNFLRNTGNLLNISGAASAVNGVQIYGGAAGVSPQLVARGDDANQDMNVRGKGTGGGALTDGGGAYKVRTNTTGVGFNGSAPIAKPAISGSRGGNAALADLLSKLVSYGLITDGTTA